MRLEHTVLHLETHGDLRNVVCVVERWAELGEPTRAARLAQARALLALRLVDRGWIRLKELAASEDGGFEAHLLTGRMFLERGWPSRARQPLERALELAPDDRRSKEVRALLATVDTPPAEATDPPDDLVDVDQLLGLGERLLAHGATTKARKALEKVRRLQPDHERAADLLWAIDGDFSLGDVTLADLVDRFMPDLATISDITDEAEFTESVTREEAVEPVEDGPSSSGGPAFPSLFRTGPPLASITAAESAEEVTQSSAMASLLHPELALPTDEEGGGDTQISRIIRNSSGVELRSVDGPIHDNVGDETGGRFDLAAFRREMGMDFAPTPSAGDFVSDLEEEDDSVVVLTGRERAGAVDDATSGLEVIEPDTTSEVRRGGAARLSEALTITDATPPDLGDRGPTPMPRRRSRHRDAAPWWLLALGITLLLGSGGILMLLIVRLLAMLA